MTTYQVRIDTIVNANSYEEATEIIDKAMRNVPVTLIEDYEVVEMEIEE